MSGIKELIEKNRSYRRFLQAEKPSEQQLLTMINSARLSASAGNLQRLRFTPIADEARCNKIFECLAFAAYFGTWRPSDDEKPTAYIVIWSETEPDTNLAIDTGISAQSVLLTARELGFGGCMFRSIKKKELTEALCKDGYVPILVIALGKPSEEVMITDAKGGNIKYFRDENSVHCVPKRSLDDIII